MTDVFARLDEVRAAGRRLDQAAPKSAGASGPIARNGEARGGWLKTVFAGAGRTRESSTERAAYLLKCQAVVAAHVIDRAQTANFPRASSAAEYQVRQVALLADTLRPLRNTAMASASRELRTVFDRPRAKTGLAANLVNFLR